MPLAAILSIALQIDPTSAPDTIAAIACKESGFRNARCATVSPYAISDNCGGRSFFPDTEARAIAIAAELLRACQSIDVGPMQVNSRNWTAYGLTLSTAFDTKANIAAGVRILGDAYQACGGRNGLAANQKADVLGCSLSRYHTGKDNEVGRAYAASVWRLAAYVPSIKDLPAPAPGLKDVAHGEPQRPRAASDTPHDEAQIARGSGLIQLPITRDE
jgi:hypothetical protein